MKDGFEEQETCFKLIVCVFLFRSIKMRQCENGDCVLYDSYDHNTQIYIVIKKQDCKFSDFEDFNKSIFGWNADEE